MDTSDEMLERFLASRRDLAYLKWLYQTLKPYLTPEERQSQRGFLISVAVSQAAAASRVNRSEAMKASWRRRRGA